MTWLLNLAYHLTHDWGLAILVVSFMVRLVLFPLSLRQVKTMLKEQKLRPQIEALQRKYKDNAAEMTQKVMELRKQEGASMMGCLMPFLQLPIFMILYRAITSLSIASGTVLIPWVVSMSYADPFHLVPILYGVLQIVGSLLRSSGQNTMIYVTTIMVVVFLWNSSVSLGIYWIVNGFFGLAEGLYYRKNIVQVGARG